MPILRIKDENGNWIPIPSIKGDKGDTPYVGDNENWWVGGVDTGVKVSPRIVTGSYVGTGNSTFALAFDFVPKCILITGNGEFGFLNPKEGSGCSIAPYNEDFAIVEGCACTIAGNTVTVNTTFYNPLNAIQYTGGPGHTYHYVAIG